MADGLTTNLSFTLPEVGASDDTWGTKLNANWSALDALFNASGYLKHESGGLEADVSAYSGLLKITGGATSAVTVTAAGEALLDDADASAQRTTLGLAIGTNVQAYDAGLASIAGLTTAADKMIYTTASDTYAVTDLSAFGRTLIDDANASTARATLGLTIGTNVQAYDALLQSISGITAVAGDILYANGSNAMTRLAKGTAGQVLTMNSGATAPEWAAISGLTYGGSQALSGSASVSITGIPSGCKRLTFVSSGISTSSNTGQPSMQLGDSGGLETTGYDGASSRHTASSAGNATSFSSAFEFIGGDNINAAANSHILIVVLTRVNEASHQWFFEGHWVNYSNPDIGRGVGSKTLTAELDRVAFNIDVGTWDAGTVTWWYE